MDKLERKVLDHVEKTDKEDWLVYADRAEQAWRLVTGLEPAYSEVVRIERNGVYPAVVVEVDGVRICAGLKYTKVKSNGFHQWKIAGRSNTDEFTLYNLKDYLGRRRKRLQKRGLYNTIV